MKRKWKQVGSLILTGTIALSLLTGCGSQGGGGSKDELSFKWWIPQTDAYGIYYNSYEENVAVQWLNNQYWDAENGGLAEEGKGKQVSLTFQVPISGSEKDNFNTMVATGEYPEILDLNYGSTPYELYQDGHLMEITEYVEKYCPNYLALLDKNPQMKNFTTYTDEEGKEHYYALYNIADNVKIPWQGYMYRRDWVVKYAEPTEYVWDWESSYVKSNGHPALTPLSAAVEADNMEGWKKNEVTSFEMTQGDDPDNDWTDNVVFPSGKPDPYTISDWEWMFEAFTKALEAEGFGEDSNAYCISEAYLGYMATGDLISSFGGGGPMWYVDQEGNAAFGGTGENFKTYLECMHNWYEKGWLDKKFDSRSSDMFYMINPNGYSQGMVGMWQGGIGDVGSGIRATCASEEGKKDAMVFGCSMPVNDVYGTEAQKYNVPDMLYQDPRLGGATGFSVKCEGKDLATLFTMLDYLYSQEGAMVTSVGLSEEQYASMSFEPDLYAREGLKAAYTMEEQGDLKVYHCAVPGGQELGNAVKAMRMASSLFLQGNEKDGYLLDRGYGIIGQRTLVAWMKYEGTATIMNYNSLMTPEDSAVYNKTNTYLNDHMGQTVPGMIKEGLGSWDDYCAKLNKYGPDKVTEIYQSYIE